MNDPVNTAPLNTAPNNTAPATNPPASPPPAPKTESDDDEPRYPLHKNPWLWGAVIGVVIITLMRPLTRYEPDAPPVLHELSDFSLTTPDGKPFTTASFAGGVTIVDFMFTRCESFCPDLSRKMAKLQKRYDDWGIAEIKLLSISVDPDYDTPPVLTEYARRFNANHTRWTFLTGPLDTVKSVVEGSFKTAMGPAIANDAGVIDIAHSGKFALVDEQGRVRGFYATDEDGLDEVFHRAQHVLRDQLRAR